MTFNGQRYPGNRVRPFQIGQQNLAPFGQTDMSFYIYVKMFVICRRHGDFLKDLRTRVQAEQSVTGGHIKPVFPHLHMENHIVGHFLSALGFFQIIMETAGGNVITRQAAQISANIEAVVFPVVAKALDVVVGEGIARTCRKPLLYLPVPVQTADSSTVRANPQITVLVAGNITDIRIIQVG